MHTDESSAWNDLHARYPMHRINHQDAYSQDGACTNGAESFFSRIRRGEIGSRRNSVPPAASTNEVCAIGYHHHISALYLHRYAQEAAFREDHRRTSNGEQFRAVLALVTRNGPSVDFCGYWQRAHAA
ncbi:possible transposase [Azospirillum doebereinerae]